jgi:hypothetical protein
VARKNPRAVAAGRRGGRARSKAKQRAARLNAKFGGRPAKFSVGDRVVANDQAPSDYRERVGIVEEVGPGRSEYGVKFDGDKRGRGYLMSWWLDRAGEQ